MAIKDVLIVTNGKKAVCKITDLSEDLKQIIRNELSAIVHGRNAVAELPDYHSYKNTLKVFIDRYESKSEDIKKGMIGELLSHILLHRFFPDLMSLSLLKNKEEQSIKKGFDIIYFDMQQKSFWYSEVKSGGKNASDTAPVANEVLLNRAYSDLQNRFSNGSRDSLWSSAIIDVGEVLGRTKKGLSIKKLLSEESPLLNTVSSTDKNAIFISTRPWSS